MPAHVDVRHKYLCTMPASRNVDIANAYSTYFNGTNEYARTGFGTYFDFSNVDPFTLAGWFKTSDNNGYLMTKMNSTPFGYGLFVNATGRYQAVLVAGAQRIDVATQTVYNDGAWHHVVMTYDGSSTAAGVTFYVAGVPVLMTTVTDTLAGTISCLTPFQINGRTSANVLLTAYEDECAVWDKELSSAEAAEVYNGGVAADLRLLSSAANLKGWWRMGDGDVSPTILDWSTSGFDLTTTNMDITNFVLDVP
jgi:hypothetical protein